MTSHWVEKRFPIRAERLLVFGAALIAACGASGDVGRPPTDVDFPTGETPGGSPSGCPGYPNQTQCPPTDGRYSISGVLTLRTTSGTVPLAGTAVGGFVIMTNGNYYGNMAPVITDADGRYQFSNVPNGFVILGAAAPHAYQPCAAVATVSGANSVQDLELVDSAATRPPTAADSPTLSGVVYRSTGAGRELVAGAAIEFEFPPEVIVLQTITDAEGRYSLCHLPAGRGALNVWLDGLPVAGSIVYISGDQVLDFDLTR